MLDGGDEVAFLRARVSALEAELEARTQTESHLRAVLEAVPSLVMRIDAKLRFVDISRPVAGYTEAQVRGTDFMGYVPEAERAKVEGVLREALATGKGASYATVGPGGDGAQAYYESYCAPMTGPAGRRELIIVAIDVTAQRARERALHERDTQLGLAFDATGIGLWAWDARLDRVSWNDGMRAITGLAEPVALAAYHERLVHPDDREEVRSSARGLLTSQAFQGRHHRIVRPSGEVRWVVSSGRIQRDADGAIAAIIGSTLDVTAHHESEEVRAHGQRLEAVGRLAAGVAHNFNNQLATILPALEVVRAELGGPHRVLLDDAIHASRRGADLIKQLLAFARMRDAGRFEPEAIDRVVERAVQMCRQLLDRRIELGYESSAGPAFVRCDAGAIEQAIVNLVVNARDAIADAGRSQGSIQVSLRTLRDERGRAHALLRVRDDGIGMPDAVRARIFEPFFTTKDEGRGTGLGLSITYATLRAHDGTIACESTPGEGTTFELRLPIDESGRAARPPTLRPARSGRREVGILLVDDDEGVRLAITMLFELMGHRALAAPDVDAALGLATEDVALVLLDRSLPGGSGRAAVQALRVRFPEAQIVYFSGHDVPDDERGDVDYVLSKPAAGDAIEAMLATLLAD